MDSLEGSSDYWLDVAVVNLDEKTEKEQNIFLNNPEAQGAYDLEKLGALYKDDGLNFQNTGFDTAQIYQMFGASPLVESPEAIVELAKQMRENLDRFEAILEKTTYRDDPDFYVVAVFENSEHRKEFLDKLGLEDNKFIDGRLLMGAINSEQWNDGEADS